MHTKVKIPYLVIEMKTFNVSQFYNGFCCYFKSCSNFDKVIKLFTLFCLHPLKEVVSSYIVPLLLKPKEHL
jgi:hypothetical protein